MKRILAILTTLSVTTMGFAAANVAPKKANVAPQTPPLATKKQKLSYSLGAMTGRTYSSHGIAVDSQAFAMGFRTAIEGGHSLLSDKEMNNVIQNFQKQDQQQAKQKAMSVAKSNLQKGQQFLKENAQKKGVVTMKSGVQFKVITAGNGKHPKAHDVVVVNYEGKLIDGTVFDSSYARGEPAQFPVNAVIQGWQQALQKMSPGAVWEVYIPAKLAYGGKNYPPSIGPNQALIFKIELISINK